ncbi:hypothetical protein SJI19_24600 [Acerihabitans sp. TG2]|nr:hypothetical protein [Acerihabitans sp. TG2]MEA9393655.1 hypothetical protein [Acerihabitans sp. TG2]
MKDFAVTDGYRERHIAGRSVCESGNREVFTASVISPAWKNSKDDDEN